MTREPKIADSGDFGRFGYISFPKIMILGIVVSIKISPSSGLISRIIFKGNPAALMRISIQTKSDKIILL